MTKIFWRVVPGLAFFLFFLGLASAQVATAGSVSGIVTDPSGSSIPGATLTITNPATGFSRTITSSGSGAYTIPGLQPGTYQLQVIIAREQEPDPERTNLDGLFRRIEPGRTLRHNRSPRSKDIRHFPIWPP